MSAGRELGVQGTPAFFLNGEMIEGAQPFEVFQKRIEAATDSR
jgi:protein-disulfide isomerase